MKVQIACLSLGLAVAAIAPADAADWNNGAGSIKDMGGSGGVPVPAPIPVPEMRGAWYFRADAGIGIINDPEISESGFVYGEDDGPGPVTGPADPMYSHPSWLSGDFNTFATFGGGVGYKFGNGFRVDGTIEKRSNDEFTMSGSDRWDTHSYYTDCCGNNVYGTDSNNNGRLDSRTYLAVTDNTKVDGTLWLANMYYDLMHGHSFTPYVGAGIGFAWNQIGRTHTSTVSTCDMETFPACDTQHQVSSTTVTGSADKVTLAAAAMAGFSYDITDITTVDMGYRYLYIAGSDISMDVGGDLSTVSFGDQHVHQLRAGLRFNVN